MTDYNVCADLIYRKYMDCKNKSVQIATLIKRVLGNSHLYQKISLPDVDAKSSNKGQMPNGQNLCMSGLIN